MHRAVLILLSGLFLAASTAADSTASKTDARPRTPLVRPNAIVRPVSRTTPADRARPTEAIQPPRLPVGPLLTLSALSGSDSEQVGDVDEPVFWTNVVGASVVGNTLTKTSTNTIYDAGGASANLIRDGFGYVEFTKSEPGRIVAGLSNGDSSLQYEDVDYAFHTEQANVHIFEAGVYRGQFGTYVVGDRFRIEVRYGVVRYFKNGQLLYTSGVAPKYPLRVDAALYDPGASLADVRVGSSTWAHDVGVALSGSSLRKTGASGWTSGAVSANTLESGDGAMEFTATETNMTRAAGLSDGDVDQGWQDIAYGIELHDDATIEVVESGTSRGTFGSYAAGDRFKVEVVAGVVTYSQNDSVFYTSTLTPSYPIIVDTALYSANATLTDIVLVPLVWTNVSGVSVSENSLTKTAGDGWNAGAQTTFALAGGSGYLEFKAIETDKRRTVGFRSGTGTAQTYADLAYAIDLGATGSVTVFEDGVSRGTFGTYTHGDRFRIEVSEGAVRYLRNATVLYTSATTPAYPLRGDVRLYSEGATVADLLGGTEPWMSRVNLTAMGSSFVKTGGTPSVWDAEARSSCGYSTGFIEFTASQTDVWRHIGLASKDTSTDAVDVDFAIHINQVGQVHVFEGPTYVAYFGGYAPGDRFRVEVANGVVRYLRNGSVFYTSTRTPTLPLRPDVNIYISGASILNTRVGGQCMVETPTISPGSGTYTSAQTATISTTTPNATIRYTVDGSTPTEASPLYTGPVAVSTSTTIKAAAFRSGWTASGTASAAYTMNLGTLPAPTIQPTGGVFTSAATVTLTSIAGATIRYTLNGADPTTSSTLYAGPFDVTATSTLKARAYHPDYSGGTVASASYTIKVAAPVLTVPSGSYAPGQVIGISTSTSGANMTYTLTGVDPTMADASIASGGTLVAGNYTLKVIAWKAGCTPSEMAQATYSITGPYTSPAAAAGGVHTVTLRSDGTLWAFGDNSTGQIGDGTTTWRPNPIRVGGLTGVKAISAHGNHTLALLGDGTVRAWGANNVGQLGDGTGSARFVPTNIGLTGVIGLSAGVAHSLAVLSDGTARAWGQNVWGELGDNSTAQRNAPVTVSGLTNVIAVAAGSGHSLALKSDGTVWGWGRNVRGEVGDGTNVMRLTPVQVVGLTNVIAIGAGDYFSIALKSDGTVWGWGMNNPYLGDNTVIDRWTPVAMIGVTDVQAIAVGYTHTILRKSDSTLLAVGTNLEGQTGMFGDHAWVARAVPGMSNVVAIAAGIGHSVAITADESVWDWGRNDGGGLGDGTTIRRYSPIQVAGPGMRWRPWIPTFGTPSGQYFVEQNAIVTNPDASAVMHYTTNGADPTEADPIVAAGGTAAINQTLVLKVKSFKAGAPPSEIASAPYELKVVAPTTSPAAGTYGSSQSVSLSTSTSSATIRYTADGGIPTVYSTAYAAALTIGTPTTLKAFAQRTGWTSSDVSTSSYWVGLSSTLTAPTITPGTGSYPSERVVSISATDPSTTIRYTIDGSDPIESSAIYRRAFAISQTTTIKARAFKLGFLKSPLASATLTFASTAAAAISVSPVGGRYTTQRLVTVTGPAGATLRYTTNGVDPCDTDTVIASGGTVMIDASRVLKVRAWSSGSGPGSVRREDYVITGALAAGEAHSIALKADGTVWTWGDNYWAQIGDGGSTQRTSPVQVLSGAVAVAAGFHHSLALKADGTVWAWGQNAGGELGDGTTVARRTPQQVAGLSGVIAIAGGFSNSYAIKADGTLWAWGANSYGQIGDGTTTARLTPTQVPGVAGALAVAASEGFAIALVSNGASGGEAWAWGANNVGQLGDGTTVGRPKPQRVPIAGIVKEVSAGRGWSSARTEDDGLLLWGDNNSGQQANGIQNNVATLLPSRAAPWTGKLQSIASGYIHGEVLGRDGRVWGWGYNHDSELGTPATGYYDYRLSIETVVPFAAAVMLVSGGYHTHAVDPAGHIYSWGYNGQGQIGDGTMTTRSGPTAIPGFQLADNAFLAGDQDADGVATWVEYQNGTDPLSADTDVDGVPDAVELAGADDNVNVDPDGDGLSNALETLLGTDPYRADTDADGVADAVDAFPTDPSRAEAPAPDPNDHTPPVITLIYPTNARPIGGGF
jgi:alpha-tubulin suppressor-like RCC1 family protein